MKKYKVTINFSTWLEVEVEAENEIEAAANAYLESGESDYDQLLLNHVVADYVPESIEEVED